MADKTYPRHSLKNDLANSAAFDTVRRTVPLLQDIRPQLARIDQQIFRLLNERCQLVWNARTDAAIHYDKQYETELLDLWLEESAECGMNEIALTRLCKCLAHLCQKTGE